MKQRSRLTLLVILMIAVVVVVLAVTMMRKPPDDTEKQAVDLEERLKQLRSVPYTTVTDELVDETRSGVVAHDPDHVSPGYNIYCSRTAPEAYIMDVSGRIVHTWTYPQEKFWVWDHMIMLTGGDAIIIEKYGYLLKLDWNSNLIWRRKMPVHHDVVELEDGTLLVIWLGLRSHRDILTRFSAIAHLTADGGEIDKWSTYDHLDEINLKFDRRSFLDTILDSMIAAGCPPESIDVIPGPVKTRRLRHGRTLYDYFHMNTLSILPDTPLGRADSRFRAGNILTCLRNVNQIAVLDRDTKEILWVWGEGVLEWPHHPTLLANGNILIFDNGVYRKYTRVIEVDPLTEAIEWEYKGDPPESFYSYGKGSAQRLPNGNTLICDGDNGRAIEVTNDGRIVWEWLNPATEEGHRVQVYRMMRLPPEAVDPLLP